MPKLIVAKCLMRNRIRNWGLRLFAQIRALPTGGRETGIRVFDPAGFSKSTQEREPDV
jgi:hypothetical protein